MSFDVPYEEWSNGYSPTITATAAETDHYKAATATTKYVFYKSIQGAYDQNGGGGLVSATIGSYFGDDKESQNQERLLRTDLDLTVRPVTEQDGNLLSSVSDEPRKKLMAAAGSDQIGAMAVDAALIDTQTGEAIHSTTGNLTLSLTGSLKQSYLENYENMACVAVHIKQDSTDSSTVGDSKDGTHYTFKDGKLVYSSSSNKVTTTTATPSPTPAPTRKMISVITSEKQTADNQSKSNKQADIVLPLDEKDTGKYNGIYIANISRASHEEQPLVSAHNDLTVVPVGSLSSKIEFIPCKLTENSVVIKDTSLSPFLLIYGPKEAFSKLLTVRAKDGVFTWDGEGHAVATEPSIANGTSLYYSLDLENWQTGAPAFTDVLWNEDGSVGSYQVYVLAENPDCDPAFCSYTVTIVPAE